MNREIKFRAWSVWYEDEEKEGMTSAEMLAFAEYDLLKNHLQESDVFFPMQFTGFKDKNGKEIYEGDIVKEKLIDHMEEEGWFWNYSVVEFEKGCWVLKQVGFDYSKYDNLFDYNLLYQDCTEVEICGNIFENPELLNS
jgi:uncharacterized phage protein (TIGR01671 family)